MTRQMFCRWPVVCSGLSKMFIPVCRRCSAKKTWKWGCNWERDILGDKKSARCLHMSYRKPDIFRKKRTGFNGRQSRQSVNQEREGSLVFMTKFSCIGKRVKSHSQLGILASPMSPMGLPCCRWGFSPLHTLTSN